MIDGAGVLTEYEIPTGPLSTAIFIAASGDGKVWFTEWAANKIGYLDVNTKLPFDVEVEAADELTLRSEESESIDVSLIAAESNSSTVSLEEVGIAVVGMTESGLEGVTYDSQQDRADIEQNQKTYVKIDLAAEDGATPGKYTLMVRATATEKDGLLVSKLYPISVVLDVPAQQPQGDGIGNDSDNAESVLRDAVRYSSLTVAIGLGGYLVYRKIKGRKKAEK